MSRSRLSFQLFDNVQRISNNKNEVVCCKFLLLPATYGPALTRVKFVRLHKEEMSNTHLFLPSGFIRAPLQNGLGRFIPQLQRITLKFCKNHGGSRGVRDFIESDLLDFAKANPGTVVYLKPRRHRSPAMVAEYLNGEREYLSCHEFNKDEVLKWISYMCTRSGIPVMRFRKYQHTDYPTIQGVWNPFTHQAPEINLAKFPYENLSKPAEVTTTATEQLLEIFKRSQIKDVSDEKSEK